MQKIMSLSALVFGVMCLSTSAIFVKLSEAPSAVTAFYRLLFALIFLIPLILFSKERREELKKLSLKRWVMSVVSGILLGIHFILWFESMKYTSVASSTVLVTLQPLFTILFSFLFLHQRQRRMGLIGCAISLAGSFFIGWGDFAVGGTALLGDIMALAAAAFISLYFFIGQFVRKDTSATVYSILGYGGSSLFLFIYSLILHEPMTGFPKGTWLSFIGLAFISTILGQFVFNLLLKWLSATSISMGILGEPVGTCILAYFILNERITSQQAIGMVIILAGLGVYFMSSPKERKEVDPKAN